MAKCDYCGTTILFGGVREAGFRFCSEKCRDSAVFLAASAELPHEFVLEKARAVHAGPCPNCGGPGPVDVHTSHTVWSLLVMTSWRSWPMVCCQACGTKAKIRAMASSTLLGWWGFPWGLLVTPAQILRNAGGLFRAPDPAAPSPNLVKMVRAQLSAQLIEESQ
jgi:hypothetical protein